MLGAGTLLVVPALPLVAAIAPPSVAAALAWTPIDVPGADSTQVNAVNTGGVVAGSYTDALGRHGFLDDHGTLTRVDVPGSTDTALTSLTDAGAATGVYVDGTVEHGFLRASDGTFTWLDDPHVVQTTSWGTHASAVSSTGTVVGWTFSVSDAGYTTYHGFVWKGGVFTPYDAPGSAYPPEAVYSGTRLTGINKAGVMVGSALYAVGDGFPDEGIVVNGTTTTSFVDPTVPVGYCGYTHPAAINDLGTVAGSSGNGCAPTQSAWLRTGSQLSYLAYPGAAQTHANSVTNGGVVAGTWLDGDGVDHGFVVTVPSATMTGTVAGNGPFYPGTVFGVRACPAGVTYGPSCPDTEVSRADSAGRYQLTLGPGTWNVAGFAWSGGDPALEVSSSLVTVTLTQGQTVRQSFTVPSLSSALTGAIRTSGPFPATTTFGVLACPSLEPFSPTCPDAVTAPADPSGHYLLAVPPGAWTVAGAAWAAGQTLVALSPPQTRTLVVGRTVDTSFQVLSPYGVVTGTVSATGPMPVGTAYGALACPSGEPLALDCPGGVVTQTGARTGYDLVLLADTWDVAGALWVGGTGESVLSAPRTLTLAARTSARLDLTISTPYGAIAVTVRTSGPFPDGTTFGAFACRTTEPFGPTCSTLVKATTTANTTAVLSALPGTWHVAAAAWVGGSSTPTVTAGPSTLTVYQGQTSGSAFTVVSPYGAVSGTVRPAATFPSGSTFGARACPAGQAFSISCPGGVTTAADAHGRYTLALTPGSWQVAGVGWFSSGFTTSPPVTRSAAVTSPASADFAVPAPTFLVLSSAGSVAAGQGTFVLATLRSVAGSALSGKPVRLAIGTATCTVMTDRTGQAGCALVVPGPSRTTWLTAAFDGDATYAGSTAYAPFQVR